MQEAALVLGLCGWLAAIAALTAWRRQRRLQVFFRDDLLIARKLFKSRGERLKLAWHHLNEALDRLGRAGELARGLLELIDQPRRPGVPIVAPVREGVATLAEIIDPLWEQGGVLQPDKPAS
ncbi:MAG TPA: hypothetical protein VHY20_10640 [Pirellulales bacterium]|nr:hypothetical protein [Pirellulales bacterium]